MKQLDPKFVWLYYVSSSLGLAGILFLITIFISPAVFQSFLLNTMEPSTADKNLMIQNFIIYFFVCWLLVACTALVGNYFWAKLTYKYYRYELREDGFRIEHGVIWKKYVTIPYERIQNVDINRGLLARIFGLSDLNIQTAGMSMGSGSFGRYAEGRLPGLAPDIAEQLRDDLIRYARGKQQGV